MSDDYWANQPKGNAPGATGKSLAKLSYLDGMAPLEGSSEKQYKIFIFSDAYQKRRIWRSDALHINRDFSNEAFFGKWVRASLARPGT